MASSSSSQHSNPYYYPHPSTVDPRAFVTIKLSGHDNYLLWKAQMLSFIQCQELEGFIDGSILMPDKVTANEVYLSWQRSDKLVKAWIFGSLEEKVLKRVADLATAKDVWTSLGVTLHSKGTEQGGARGARRCGVINDKVTDAWKYLPLYRAAIEGDWTSAEAFKQQNPDASYSALISNAEETALHIAVGTKKGAHFIRKLVDLMTPEEVELQTTLGYTALSIAALVGNTHAARILVDKNSGLLYIKDKKGRLPLHLAALYGQRDTLLYLQGHERFQWKSEYRPRLYQNCLLMSGIFDIALEFSKARPDLVQASLDNECQCGGQPHNERPPLAVLAEVPHAFHSTCQFSFIDNIIYQLVPIKFHMDNENSTDVHSLMQRVPRVKDIQGQKLRNQQALELLKWFCSTIKTIKDDHYQRMSTDSAIITAAHRGAYEVVEEILYVLPSTARMTSSECNILQMAVLSRCEKVFNLIFQMSGWKEGMMAATDKSGNNILHMAGRLAPTQKLNLVSGAALQMQRELQWFEGVQEFVNPVDREERNGAGETPRMVFTKEHKDLVREGERWMKDTATSCTITAALIATIAFTAAITVPGGNNADTGLPFFAQRTIFVIFCVSDAISLFTSTISLLMFLGILTARYAEEDFRITLPTRLILGLVSLFISITSMLVAFSATIYWMFGQGKQPTPIWTLISLASLPVTSFVIYQFPLLVDVFSSTFVKGIFVKQGNRQLH